MKRALWLSSGVLVWALHFTLIYGATGLACARGMERVVPWGVGVATAIAAAAAAWIAVRGVRRGDGFNDAMMAGLAGLALLGILWEGSTVLLVAPCVTR